MFDAASPEPPAASILHADLDAFFASVEIRDDPRLRGRPVAVGGGVVLAASYEARRYGVHGAMGGREAKARCPDLLFVRPRFDAYTEASKAVFAIFERTTPIVEGISIDEAFLDVRGLRRVSGDPVSIARTLRAQVREEVGLPITVGIAATKFLAKVASAVGKPDGLLHVPAGEELSFLHPLPIERLWGVGPKTAAKLHDRGFHTVGDIAAVDEELIVSILGRATGHQLWALAHNHDPRRVRRRARRRSIGGQRALGSKYRSPAEVDAVLVGLVDRITRRLRDAERVGRTVTVGVRFDDFGRATRSHALDQSTDRTDTLLAAARALLADLAPTLRTRGLTLLSVSIGQLDDDTAVQLELPFSARRAVLDNALDDVRRRFGPDALGRAVMLDRDPGYAMPTLAD